MKRTKKIYYETENGMSGDSVVKRLIRSLKVAGVKTTVVKAVHFATAYIQKTPFERMLMLRYRYQANPTDLAEPTFQGAEYQNEIDYSEMSTDLRAIAFYDPSGCETFADGEMLSQAAALARKHGIYGFCFFYRDGSDNKLVEWLNEHPEIEIQYCLCRIWTTKPTGNEAEINFIKKTQNHLVDSRYIRVNGQPLLLSLNSQTVAKNTRTFLEWRKHAQDAGIGDLQIWACRTSAKMTNAACGTFGANAEVEMPPYDIPAGYRVLRENGKAHDKMRLYSYVKLSTFKKVAEQTSVTTAEPAATGCPLHSTCVLGWDKGLLTSAEHVGLDGFSPWFFYNWLLADASYTRRNFTGEERIMFVSGWTGCKDVPALAPNELHGFLHLNTLSKALFSMPLRNDVCVIGEHTGNRMRFDDTGRFPRIAVQAHIFFLDTLDEIIDELNNIPFRFDCYVSTDTGEKRMKIEQAFAAHSHAEHVFVECFLNRGRDVAPLLQQMAPVIDRYDYIAHVHGKRSTIVNLGAAWRKYLMRNLLNDSQNIRGILSLFEHDEKLGIVYPDTFPLLHLEPVRDNERVVCEDMLKRCGYKTARLDAPVFPAGNMFWARSKAISKLFHVGLSANDFPSEKGQQMQTLAHHIERLWVDLAANEGYDYKTVWNCCDTEKSVANKRRMAFFVHFDKDCVVSDSDVAYVRELSKYTQEVLFITNSALSDEELNKVRFGNVRILLRENIGFDFGAWKDAVAACGLDRLCEFDQLIFANNSCFAPLWSLSKVLNEMDGRKAVDFWGITEYPRGYAAASMDKLMIDTHIQSYFFVMEKTLVASPAFEEFWNRVAYHEKLIDVIEYEETEMTKFFTDRGFYYDVYISESTLLTGRMQNADPYIHPKCLLLLGSPLVKKKTSQFAFIDERIRLQHIIDQIHSGGFDESEE